MLKVSVTSEKSMGWAGNLLYDFRSALVVTPIALTFGLAIASASEAPAITAGLVSSIVAGFIVTIVRGSYTTIYGPAAGLAPVLVWGAFLLGDGDVRQGYNLLPLAIALCGVVQILLAWLKAANLSSIIPHSVMEGMMGGVGILIIGKQLPKLLGVHAEGHEFLELVRNTLAVMPTLDLKVFGLGVGSLLCLFGLDYAKRKWQWRILKFVPSQLILLVLGSLIAWAIAIPTEHLIKMPQTGFQFGFSWPDVSLLHSWSTVRSLGLVIVIISMVGVTETLATTCSMDKKDAQRRKSNLNRVLLANGLANFLSGLFGGLAVVPGGVKSTTNQEAGGHTTNVNAYVAILLVLCVFWFQNLLTLVPYTVLAAMLIAVGFKLVLKLRHVAVHWQQAVIFVITAMSAVYWDLAIGVLWGMVAKLSLCLYYVVKGMLRYRGKQTSTSQYCIMFREHVKGLFRSPVTRAERDGDTYCIYFAGPLVCFNLPAVQAVLAQVPTDARKVDLYVDSLWCHMIDPTSHEYLCQWGRDMEAKGIDVEYPGLADMIRASCMLLSPSFVGMTAGTANVDVGISTALAEDALEDWGLLEEATHGPPGSQNNGDETA